jgi:N-acetylmuramoyl-L-alanine amidase
MRFIPSPNFNDRRGKAVQHLILHYTGMPDEDAAIARLCDPTAEVSAHYVVRANGEVLQLVDESMRAWHAGKSFWAGETDINATSIGIEICNPGHEFGYVPFPEVQVDAVTELCRAILSRHAIPARHVLGHSDIAPTRKQDPGEFFPWARLAAAGVGLFERGEGREARGEGDLALYGYDTSNMPAAICAFQRHFRPDGITGEWDTACGEILAALIGRQ